MNSVQLLYRCCFAALLTAGLALGWPVRAAPATPTAEDFASPPQLDDVVLSPSGRRMALLVTSANGRVRLGVMDLDPTGEPRIVAAFGDANVKHVRWLNDDRLVFEAARDGAVIYNWGAGTFAVNHDGSEQLQLIAWADNTSRGAGSLITSRILPYGWYLHSTVDDGSNDVFVYREVRDAVNEVREVQLARLDTKTRSNRSLSSNMPDGTRGWLLDASKQPRIVVARREGKRYVYWRDPEGAGEWTEIDRSEPVQEQSFTPLWVEENGNVLVTTRIDGEVRALHRLDPRNKRIDPKPLVRVSGFDVDAQLELDSKTNRVLGLHLTLDRPMSVWFDEGLQVLQQGIDAALPKGRVNRIYCGRCESSRFFVIKSTSDRQPGEYFLFDRTNASLQRLGPTRPRIDEATQGSRTYQRVKTRDGLSMPVYVTHPAGSNPKQALPAVVLVHGGPWARGASLVWNADAQFLASRGYRVIEPEFRGSTGYGMGHYRAGWKQWGGKMQDDLIDAVQWATGQGMVDPARVCVVGASYGGYAALMAPILHPAAFKCAASFAGVTDILAMYEIQWSDITEDSRRYGMPALIGDPGKDKAMLAASSPLKRVAEIEIPILVTHGGNDRRVPLEHSSRFVKAARAAGVKVEAHTYLEEGHGFFDPSNQADHYRRLEKFLGQHLSAGDSAATKP